MNLPKFNFLIKKEQDYYIKITNNILDFKIENKFLLFCYLHMCIFLDSSIIFLSDDIDRLDSLCLELSQMFPLGSKIFAINIFPIINSNYKILGIESKNLTKNINLNNEKEIIFISRFNCFNEYKKNERLVLSGIASYSFIKSNINNFLRVGLDKSSVFNSINKVSSIIYINSENFEIYELSWLSKGEIISGNTINNLDMFSIRKLNINSSNIPFDSKILQKYSKIRGSTKDYTNNYFKSKLAETKTLNFLEIFKFNSFINF
ncbi:MAG: hypothetical protein QXD23_02620 [Candidatus Micrarchaeaceae archaeon]